MSFQENIIDASQKLDEINMLRVVNYNLESASSLRLIGFVPSEFALVFPGLVGVYDDTEYVKESVLIPILVKSIQELTARVVALENI